jgi:hypothetical protein
MEPSPGASDGGGHIGDQDGQVELFDVDLELAGLDLRQVEDLVDQVQQMRSGPGNAPQRLDEVVLAGIGGVLDQHFGNADDGVQRRAQLMAHVGEELALGQIGFFGLLLTAFEFGDVGIDGNGAVVVGPAFADPEPQPVVALLEMG